MKITKKQLKQLVESVVAKHLNENDKPSVLQPLGRSLRKAELSQEELQVVKNAFRELGAMASAEGIPLAKIETLLLAKIRNFEDKEYLIGLAKKGWLRHKSQQAFPVRESKDKHLNEAPPEGWHGTTRAMITKHPEKFQEPGEKKKPGEINPWALAHSMKKKGAEPHYKEQETSLKGKPEKKEKFKNEELTEEAGNFRWCTHCKEKVNEKECPFCGKPTKGADHYADKADSLKEDYAPGMYKSVEEIIEKYENRIKRLMYHYGVEQNVIKIMKTGIMDAYELGKEDGVEEYTAEHAEDSYYEISNDD